MASDSRWLYKLTCLILSDGRVALEVRADIGKSADSEGDARMNCHIGKYGLDHSVQHLNFLFEGPGSRQERRFRFDPLTANRVSLFRVLRRFQTWQVPMRQPRSRAHAQQCLGTALSSIRYLSRPTLNWPKISMQTHQLLLLLLLLLFCLWFSTPVEWIH